MTKIIVMTAGKDRKQEQDLSPEVRFSAKLNIRRLNTPHSDQKKFNTSASSLAYLL